MKEELSRKYSKEVCMACESMTYGKRTFTLPQKFRLSANFNKHYIKKFGEEIFENVFSEIGFSFCILMFLVVLLYSFYTFPNW